MRNSSRFIWGEVTLSKYRKKDYVLYFGRFSEKKGINTLIKVCKELPDVQFNLRRYWSAGREH